MEKQIEEMILTVKNAVSDNAVIDLDEDIITLNGNDLDHVAEQTAEALYNAGYRKQSENVIELPCKVGQRVFVIEPLWYGIWAEDEHKCHKCEHFYEGGMGDSPDCSLGKNCCYHIVEKEADLRSLADWIIPSMFIGEIAWGKTVFLNKEEAKKALAQRSNR